MNKHLLKITESYGSDWMFDDNPGLYIFDPNEMKNFIREIIEDVNFKRNSDWDSEEIVKLYME